jgi:TolA-binding protein
MLSAGLGCSVYFNTFFNAKKSFNAAEKTRRESNREKAGQRDYQEAIEGALKVVERHPNSKYYDDAVYVLGVSYFFTEQYSKAERRFRELLADYPDSKYVREAKLYLAKTKLKLGDMDEAMVGFSEIFESDYDRAFKAEAAIGLGNYHHDDKNYEEARRYFRAVRDSLGDDLSRRTAQMNMADGYFEMFQFRDALGAYLQVLGMEPERDYKYHAQYQSALCSFRLQRIDAGIVYLEELAADELYYDSLGILLLTMAEGYEFDDDLEQAESIYEQVISTIDQSLLQAMASYRLGLIYQIDYDQLDQAAKYYDKAAKTASRSPIRDDAIMRSTDIGKLKRFARSELDSAATPEALDDAAYTQYLLGELYWFKLAKPDSAIIEMRYLVDSFATTYYAPKGMIALAEMIREYTGDSTVADSILKETLRQYPASDFLPEALEALSLKGTAADTGYAALHIDAAENFLIDDDNADSALVRYQYVVDNFPESEYFLPASFALIWLTETYFSPGDSSVIFAYQEFADSFSGSEYANRALRRLGGQTRRTQSAQVEADDLDGNDIEADFDTISGEEPWRDSVEEWDPMVALYRGLDGDTLVDIRMEPIETLIEFEFPDEAAIGTQNDWRLFFQILIDFTGRVIDFSLKIPSGIEQMDERAMETVESMTFDAMEVSNRVVDAGMSAQSGSDGTWFVYEYKIVKPEYLR